jgi:hypothetical protein
VGGSPTTIRRLVAGDDARMAGGIAGGRTISARLPYRSHHGRPWTVIAPQNSDSVANPGGRRCLSDVRGAEIRAIQEVAVRMADRLSL